MIDLENLKSELSKNSTVGRNCDIQLRLEGDLVFIEGVARNYYQKQVILHVVLQHIKNTPLTVRQSICVKNSDFTTESNVVKPQ
jgi:hypothetical protein